MLSRRHLLLCGGLALASLALLPASVMAQCTNVANGTPETQAYLLSNEFQNGRPAGSITPGCLRDLIASTNNVVPATVSAAGTTLAGATVLVSQTNIVTGGTGGVVVTAGYTSIWNDTANTIQVYPVSTSAQFETSGNGIPIQLASGAKAEVEMTTTTQGYYRITAAAAPVNSSFTVSGGQLLDPTGAPFRIYGVNIWGCAEGTTSNKQNAVDGGAALSQQLRTVLFPGLNFVRIAFKQGCNSQGGNWGAYAPSSLDAFVNDATANKVLVEIEDHDTSHRILNGGTSPTLAQEHTWYANLATHFKNNPYVAFGTMNEPGYPTSNGSAGELNQIQDIYAAIRTTAGSNAIVFVAAGQNDGDSLASLYDCGTGWCNQGAPSATVLNAIAGFHGVAWELHTYNLCSSCANVSAYNNSLNGSFGAAEYQIATSQDGVIPVFGGEIGNSGNGSSADGNATIEMQANWTNPHTGWGAAAWALDNSSYNDINVLIAGNYTLPANPTLSAYGANTACYIARTVPVGQTTASSCPAP